MKVTVISATFLAAITPVAMAEARGIPPVHRTAWHARYGSKPDKGTNPSGNAIGRTGSKASDDRKDGTGAQDANKGQDRK